jgi:hypothetical protein
MDGQEREAPQFPVLMVGALVLVLGVAAYLTLVLTGHAEETDKLLGFLSPVVAAIFIVGYQQRAHAVTEQRLTEQDQKLQTITEQTNGVLNRKIYDNTVRAFTESEDIAQAIRQNTRAELSSMLAAHLDGGERNGAVD